MLPTDPGTDAFEAALDIPEGWVLANNHDNHLTWLYVAEDDLRERHTLAAMPALDSADGWNLIALTGYEPAANGNRALQAGVSLEDVLAAAQAEMQAVRDGNPSVPDAGLDTTGAAGEESTADTESTDSRDSGADPERQAALTEW